LLTHPKEIAILKVLSEWPETISNAGKNLRPHYIVAYLIKLADVFNQWYQNVPILKAEPKIRLARLALTAKTAEIVKTGLNLLGIEVLERM
jgi:arginyl-tRNA synthetase